MYDPTLARFHTIDPLSEMFSHQTTYAYADNNPIRFIDFMGMNSQDSNKNDEDDEEKKKNQRPEYTISLYGNKNVGDAKAKFGSQGTAELGADNTDFASSGGDGPDLRQNRQEKLISAGVVLTAVPEGASSLVGLGMIATGGILYLWDKFVYDKDCRLDVSKLHYTHQPPSLNPIHNQPEKPQFNPGEFEKIVRWVGGISIGATGIKNLYETTQVKPLYIQPPVNQPDKTRVERPQFYLSPKIP